MLLIGARVQDDCCCIVIENRDVIKSISARVKLVFLPAKQKHQTTDPACVHTTGSVGVPPYASCQLGDRGHTRSLWLADEQGAAYTWRGACSVPMLLEEDHPRGLCFDCTRYPGTNSSSPLVRPVQDCLVAFQVTIRRTFGERWGWSWALISQIAFGDNVVDSMLGLS